MANLTEMAMTKPRSKKALFIGLPLALAISAGAGFAVWHHWFKDDLGYPAKVMKQALSKLERLLIAEIYAADKTSSAPLPGICNAHLN